MRHKYSEKVTSRIIAAALGLVTVVVFTQSVTDPVNVTKLFLLGGFSFASFGAFLSAVNQDFFKNRKFILMALGFFALVSLVTLFESKAPFTQSLYGVYGRNNGYLMYFLLSLLFLSSLSLSKLESFKAILLGLCFAGIINVAYAMWVLAFGDFVGWSNPYGNLLGTLGNPDFIGSFFGMFGALLFAFAFSSKSRKAIRVACFLILPLVFLGIIDSHAVQGKVLFIFGFAISSFYWVRAKFESNILSIGYFGSLVAGFFVAFLGTLQKGPLAHILYKETVSLRGQYWYAGWKTGLTHPLFGVGFDSLGDWYRRSRRESALTLPGIDTVTNASHNVFLDIFAFGGWPLFISYILLVVVVIISILRFSIRNRSYDPYFVSLIGVWLCYELQSTISINQIGLAIWGWVFGAAIIAYEISDARKSLTQSVPGKLAKNKRPGQSTQLFGPGISASLACLIGFILVAPPLASDMKWRTAQLSRDVNKVEMTLEPSYMNPQNSLKFIETIGIFETNKFYSLAHKYALESVKFNPDSYESWRVLYQISQSTQEEKNIAMQNMKRLDPLNRHVGTVNK